MVKMDYIWDRTTEFLGDHLSAVLPIAVIGILVPTAIVNTLGPYWASPDREARVVLGLVTFAAIGALLWAYLAISALVIESPARSRVSGLAAQRLLPLIGVYLVLMLGFVALTFPIGLLAAVAGVDMLAMRTGQVTALPSAATGASLALYMLLFIVILLVVMARLLPISAVVVAERRGIGAIAQAWRLTRGMTWRLTGVTILYLVVSQVSGLAARTVFGTILSFVSPGDAPISVGTVITAIIVAAVSTGFTVLSAVFAAKLYVAVLRERESATSYALTDRLESDGAPS